MKSVIKTFITDLQSSIGISLSVTENKGIYTIHYKGRQILFECFRTSPMHEEVKECIHLSEDILQHRRKQIISLFRSKLNLNKRIFARNCEVKRIDSSAAKSFMNDYHIMGYATSASHYGLFYNKELVAVSTFSKGRKMRRLPEEKRSFELIRFCTLDGVTVTGGLTKLLQTFIKDKKPGDIMTYIDKLYSEGKSYLVCGFHKLGESEKQKFLIRKSDLKRSYFKGETIDPDKYYLSENLGNIKLVLTIE